MRKVTSLVLVALLASLPVTAEAGKKRKKNKAKQEESGSILLQAPADPVDTVCFNGLHRRVNVYAQGQFQGVVGYHFEVDPKTAGLPFELKVESGEGDVDLDISFYQSMGDPADPAGAPGNVSFEEHKPGGEHGVVPEGFPVALVCAYSGFNIEWSYLASAKVKTPQD